MIPGCGPQIAFTAFALGSTSIGEPLAAGMFAALSANTILQSGDSGIALLAVDKKTALVMIIVNSIPALIVGITISLISLGGSVPFGI